MEQSCRKCTLQNPSDAKYCQRCGAQLSRRTDPLLGKQIGNFRIDKKIGVGGMGVVYLAEHINLGKKAAIKFLHPQFASDQEVVERFRREAQVLSTLDHPNIIRESDFGWLDGVGFYLVMEYLQGDTIKDLLKKEKTFDVEKTKSLFEQLYSALEEAHEHNIVHRDLKPENLFISKKRGKEVLKILDFGIARFAYADDQNGFTMDGEVYGSPNYMSPEQARGEIHLVDHRADLYATGIMLVEFLIGRLPYQGQNAAEVMLAHISKKLPTLRQLAPRRQFPDALEDFVKKILAKIPQDRFDSAQEANQNLQAALNELSNVTPSELPNVAPPKALALPSPSLLKKESHNHSVKSKQIKAVKKSDISIKEKSAPSDTIESLDSQVVQKLFARPESIDSLQPAAQPESVDSLQSAITAPSQRAIQPEDVKKLSKEQAPSPLSVLHAQNKESPLNPLQNPAQKDSADTSLALVQSHGSLLGSGKTNPSKSAHLAETSLALVQSQDSLSGSSKTNLSKSAHLAETSLALVQSQDSLSGSSKTNPSKSAHPAETSLILAQSQDSLPINPFTPLPSMPQITPSSLLDNATEAMRAGTPLKSKSFFQETSTENSIAGRHQVFKSLDAPTFLSNSDEATQCIPKEALTSTETQDKTTAMPAITPSLAGISLDEIPSFTDIPSLIDPPKPTPVSNLADAPSLINPPKSTSMPSFPNPFNLAIPMLNRQTLGMPVQTPQQNLMESANLQQPFEDLSKRNQQPEKPSIDQLLPTLPPNASTPTQNNFLGIKDKISRNKKIALGIALSALLFLMLGLWLIWPQNGPEVPPLQSQGNQKLLPPIPGSTKRVTVATKITLVIQSIPSGATVTTAPVEFSCKTPCILAFPSSKLISIKLKKKGYITDKRSWKSLRDSKIRVELVKDF